MISYAKKSEAVKVVLAEVNGVFARNRNKPDRKLRRLVEVLWDWGVVRGNLTTILDDDPTPTPRQESMVA